MIWAFDSVFGLCRLSHLAHHVYEFVGHVVKTWQLPNEDTVPRLLHVSRVMNFESVGVI